VTGPLAEEFRAVMAGVATPVSVVSTVTDGRPHGTTVSAFASLSMSPPMVAGQQPGVAGVHGGPAGRRR
jgi:flavin reductase (DIM6/NTAB) family NADH-FMN oxidoreductase RutF